jgi:hypothetical protein
MSAQQRCDGAMKSLALFSCVLASLYLGPDATAQVFLGTEEQLVEEAVLAGDRIVAHVGDSLRSYDLEGLDETPLLPTGVIDIVSEGDVVWAVTTGSSRALQVVRLEGSISSELPPLTITDGYIAAAAAAGSPFILTYDTLYRFDGVSWRHKSIVGQLEWYNIAVAALSGDGLSLYVGYDNGEWGGGLRRIDVASGRVLEIEKFDPNDRCAGPLYSGCSPVTAIVADPSDQNCMLVATGLVHFLESGALLRVCGGDVDTALTLPLREYFLGENKLDMTEAIFGLAVDTDGYWALTRRALHRVDANGHRAAPYELQSRGGLFLASPDEGIVLLATNARARVSVSGTTPTIAARH